MLDHSDESSVIFRIKGHNAEAVFANETGKHVIQRIPATERNGRKQTSIVGVAVLPLQPELSKSLLPWNEIEWKAQCGGGPGGQNVNKTASTVRMRHKPSGEFVCIMNERSQEQNKELARRILSAKVNQQKNMRLTGDYSQIRKERVGDGGRGDKVRTYNLMESRVVDHRLGTKTTQVKEIMKGNLDLILAQ